VTVVVDPGGGVTVVVDPGGGVTVVVDPGGGVTVVVDDPGTTLVSVVVPGTAGWVNFVPAGGCGFTSMSMSPCAVGGATGSACPGMPPGEASCAWATPHPNTSAIAPIAATIPLFMPLPFPSKPPTTTAHEGRYVAGDPT
jgi:hypothetical protein